MTASFNTSVLSSSASAAKQNKKGCRSSKSNNYQVEVVDFDGDFYDFQVEAASFSEASAKAESAAHDMCLIVNYLNIYLNN